MDEAVEELMVDKVASLLEGAIRGRSLEAASLLVEEQLQNWRDEGVLRMHAEKIVRTAIWPEVFSHIVLSFTVADVDVIAQAKALAQENE